MKVFTNIKHLVQVREPGVKVVKGREMAELPVLENAWLMVGKGRIEAFGSMTTYDAEHFADYEVIDLENRSVLPCWIDSHTHIVFAEWREREFVDRIKGLSYEEIAQRGGGILNSARKMQEAAEDELFWAALGRLNEVVSQGTGAIEIKSGYGLTPESELKMLRVIQRLKNVSPIPVKATFLGAHAFPAHLRDAQEVYVDQVIHEMLPQVAREGLADYVDAFCEKGYFSVEQTERIIKAAADFGLKAKVHVNQFNAIGGVAMCVEQGVLSADHLEVVEETDLRALLRSEVMPVSLPSCSFFLGIPYTPARWMIDAGLPLALASDYNPGSTPTGNMNFIVSLACIQMKMTPAEAINAATINAAAALELSGELGSITPGKRANFIVTNEVPDVAFLPYAFGSNHVHSVYLDGKLSEQR